MMRRLLAAALLALPVAVAAQTATPVWRYAHDNAGTGQSSEIAAFDAQRGELWVLGGSGIEILAWQGTAVVSAARFTCPNTGTPNSIAIRAGLVAATFSATPGQVDGWLCLFEAKTRALLDTIQVGATPDMVAFTPNGRKLVVVNEAERIGAPGPAQIDPPGSVTIVALQGKRYAGIEATIGFPATLPGARVAPGKSATVDIEPEYATISSNSKTAWVTLQENNAIAEIDLDAGVLVRVLPLGTKSYASDANAIDPSDRDGRTELRPVPVASLYQPDAVIDVRGADGQVYLVTANEGDARSDDSDVARAGDIFSDVPADLRRLNVSTFDSTATALVGIGGRSISVRDLDGNLVWDSGKTLDAEAIARGLYADARSDDKGVEPEGLAVAVVGGRTILFVGLERTTTSAVAMFDFSDPRAPRLLDFIVGAGDVSPEGLVAFERDGRLYLSVSHEVSHSTTLYEIAP